ncbi:MAG: ATP-dependent protease [Candidatus Omnitrophica bacterium]|nr:ATP-dependent protease [Candidatus Omnitrophota bacterium]
MKSPFELSPQDLRNECDPATFDFEATDQISVEDKMIGQERALSAIEFGLNMKSQGYNLYVAGITGTGKTTAIIRAVKELAKNESIPDDLCYLYNFERPDEPKALKLSAGLGYQFKKDTEELVKDLETEIQKAFLSEDYERHKKGILDRFEEEKERLNLESERFARQKGFLLQQTLTGLMVVPVVKGRPATEMIYEKLSPDEKERLKKEEEQVHEKLYDNSRKIRELWRQTKSDIEDLDKRVGLYATGHLIDELRKKYSDQPEILKHLDDIQKDILENLDSFKKEGKPEIALLPAGRGEEDILKKYGVNLLVDNCNTRGAPVVIEHNPTYYNLVGNVEYRPQFGVLTTDFTMIKAGAAHKANGGYLILQAHELLRDYFAWSALKKIMLYKRVKIENVAELYGFAPTAGLKPEPMPVDLKVVIVGNPLIYHLLYVYDEDLRKLFKVKVDFDTSNKRTPTLVYQYAHFMAAKCKEENLMPFKKDAVAQIVNYGSRLISHKEKLSARFLEIVDIMRESDYWARREGAKLTERRHVKKALEEKFYRSNLIEEKIRELIRENTLIIDTEGRKAGSINGISVLDMGDYSFGRPSRITAVTFSGKGGIINLERQVKMSGSIHSKGVLILSGYLGSKYAQDKPLALSASVCFEQLYEEVEGDSASSTELYCLLSSLAGLPLRQDIAVTGSVDQQGRVQPVGGINEKIEGFFEACRVKGMTGTQGVIIPKENVKHLMLKDEVIEAVAQGKFHVYSVETIDEGIEILTGVEAGKLSPDGSYPKDTVNYRVNEKLKAYADLSEQAKKKE